MKPDVKVILIGVAVLVVLAIYAYSGLDFSGKSVEIKKADFASLYAVDSLDAADELLAEADSAKAKKTAYNPDTTQNILFIGDSMLEGLTRRFIDYADENGHNLHTVVWYSSSTEIWANSDTLQYFLAQDKPSYVVICLGGNELFVKDIDKRKEYIKKIVGKIGDIPYVWVGPPNWKEDTGINDAILSVVGDNRFFLSKNLKMERKSDHAHPTYPAAAIWMDTIARWLSSPERQYPVTMKWPEKDNPPRNVTMLAPVRN